MLRYKPSGQCKVSCLDVLLRKCSQGVHTIKGVREALLARLLSNIILFTPNSLAEVLHLHREASHKLRWL